MKKNIYTIPSLLATLLVLLMSCENGDHSPASERVGPNGQGGSMARFAVTGNYLYTVDHHKLNLFNITDPSSPVAEGAVQLSFGVETIFPYQNMLFIGTQSGMHIMSIDNPASPRELAHYMHTVSCDPVVTDGRYAYITLSTGTSCNGAINELQVLDLEEITRPTLIQQYMMSNPKGLGIANNRLFVCDQGLKMYDAANPRSLRLMKTFPINAYDVIPYNGHVLAIGSDGFYQYKFENDKLELLSKISVQPK